MKEEKTTSDMTEKAFHARPVTTDMGSTNGLVLVVPLQIAQKLADENDAFKEKIIDLERRAATGDAVEAMPLDHRIGHHQLMDGTDMFEVERVDDDQNWEWVSVSEGITAAEALGLPAPEIKA